MIGRFKCKETETTKGYERKNDLPFTNIRVYYPLSKQFRFLIYALYKYTCIYLHKIYVRWVHVYDIITYQVLLPSLTVFSFILVSSASVSVTVLSCAFSSLAICKSVTYPVISGNQASNQKSFISTANQCPNITKR